MVPLHVLVRAGSSPTWHGLALTGSGSTVKVTVTVTWVTIPRWPGWRCQGRAKPISAKCGVHINAQYANIDICRFYIFHCILLYLVAFYCKYSPHFYRLLCIFLIFAYFLQFFCIFTAYKRVFETYLSYFLAYSSHILAYIGIFLQISAFFLHIFLRILCL